MEEQNNEVFLARREYFDTIKQKNEIDHCRIDELDIDNIGISLNIQNIELMKLATTDNKSLYRHYQDSLISLKTMTKKSRYMLILKNLYEDKEVPTKIKEIIAKMYEQIRINSSITEEIIYDVIIKLIGNLPTDLQELMYKKINTTFRIEQKNMKNISIEESLKLLSYVENDYTFISFEDVTNYNNYVNPNGTFFKEDLKKMLDFAYENGKQVRITSLIDNDNFPTYLSELPSEMIKQRLINYVDELTRYIKVYNSTHKRLDRKKIVFCIDILNDLITENNKIKKIGFLKYLSFEDILDVLKVARKNLPEINFIYYESDLIKIKKRECLKEIIKFIQLYEKNNKIKILDTIGIKLCIDLDTNKEDILDMINDLNNLELDLVITEFELNTTEFMLTNNNKEEIESLRDRYITDFCNLIKEINSEKKVKINTINIKSVFDTKDKPYNGIYDSNLNRKEEKLRIRALKKQIKVKGKSFNEIIWIIVILLVLTIIIYFICKTFIKLI